MKRLLLDTHVWVWYVAGSKKLPVPLREAIDEAVGLCWLSPISLWEADLMTRLGRIRIRQDQGDWIEHALAAHLMREAPVNFEVARTATTVDLPNGDPADRFLAATALVYDLTLVTVDPRFAAASWLDTLTG